MAFCSVFSQQNAHNVLVASSPVAPYGLVAKVADLGLARVLGNATAGVTQTVRAFMRCGVAYISRGPLTSV
jgi:hypothetical protein